MFSPFTLLIRVNLFSLTLFWIFYLSCFVFTFIPVFSAFHGIHWFYSFPISTLPFWKAHITLLLSVSLNISMQCLLCGRWYENLTAIMRQCILSARPMIGTQNTVIIIISIPRTFRNIIRIQKSSFFLTSCPCIFSSISFYG